MKVTSMKSTSWQNLIHMTTTGKNGGALGDRIPNIWLEKSGEKIRVEIGTSSVNNIF